MAFFISNKIKSSSDIQEFKCLKSFFYEIDLLFIKEKTFKKIQVLHILIKFNKLKNYSAKL